MTDETTATGETEDLFKGIRSEEYDRGELVEREEPEAPPVEEKPEDPPAEDAEVETDEQEEQEDEQEEGKPKETAPRNKNSVQQRIADLTKARRDAERRATELELRLIALEQKNAPPVEEEAPPAKVAADADAKGPPNSEDYEFGSLDEGYIRDLAEYHADRRFQQLMSEREQREAQTRAEAEANERAVKFQRAVEAAQETYPDYHERVILGAARVEWQLSEHMGPLLVESEVGPDIAYYLASNPQESARVFALSPVEQARYFGRLEAKFSAQQDAAPSKTAGSPATVRAPQAPPPVPQARGKSGQFQATARSNFNDFEQAAREKGVI